MGEAGPEIGLVGLGRMGVPICANLVRAGYAVRAADRRPEAAAAAARCGARWVPELARLAASADVLVTVLPGANEVREVMLGADGVAAALRGGTTWIDMTSNSPAAMTEVRDAVLERGVQVLDAPVGGGPAAARRGALQMLIGGQAHVVAQHRDLLEVLTGPGRLRHVGGNGAGYTAKLLINLLWFGQAVATAEALLLGRASGLDLGVLRDVLGDSAVGSRFIDHDLPALFAGDVMPAFGLDRCYEELQDRDGTGSGPPPSLPGVRGGGRCRTHCRRAVANGDRRTSGRPVRPPRVSPASTRSMCARRRGRGLGLLCPAH
jgi:3-hydroxyisobutyrate dehydrogenase